MIPDEFDIFKQPSTSILSLSDSAVKLDNHSSNEVLFSNPLLNREKKPTLLIIDDDASVRDSLAYALEEYYELIFCASGEDGIAKANAEISAVVLDIKMQGKDGFQTFTEIKQKHNHLPIIFHSAYQDLKDPYEIMNEFHPFGYINKQGSAKELSTMVSSAVEYNEQFRQNEVLLKQVQQLNTGLEQKVAEKTQSLTHALADLVENNKALELARQAAVDAAESKALFLANMSHEIRTPMNAVISMTELLMDTPLDPEQKDWLQIILGSGESLLSLINDILDFSKIEAGKLDLEIQPFKLSDCIESSLDLLSIRAAQLSLSLNYYIEPDVPSNLLGDSTRLRQILLNLLSNALKFTEKGEINIEVRCLESNEQQAKLQFAIRDSGIGIAADKLKTLFQAFTQAELSTTRQYGGTGLGLTISKRLSELMKGEIWVDSVIGEGSCFYFSIVVKLSAKIDSKPKEIQCFNNKKILLCSDYQRSGQHQLKQLQQWQSQVTLVSLEQANACLIQQSWDCIIIDYNYTQQAIQLVKKVHEHCRLSKQNILLLLDKTQENFNLDKSNIARKPLKINYFNQQLRNLLYINSVSKPESTFKDKPKLICTENQPLRILLAEDNKVNQTVALLRLKKLGYSADIANNGLEVLKALETKIYDVILMDVQMPEMDGLTATQEIHHRWANNSEKMPYIIAMTANAMQGDKQQCLDVGMHDYLSKPVRSEGLYTALLKAAEF